MMFHSYRKIREGNLDLGAIIKSDQGNSDPNYISRSESATSLFKKQILNLLMAKAGLFESIDSRESNETINQLNTFFQQYAGGTISKLKPSPDSTVDIRIKPSNGEESFTFDGLSSGQKEIISTLFLIWYHTRNKPALILIDEPELHLNAQWHRSFVKNIVALAPQNQYILATHSEDIMDSVDKDRRLLITRSEMGGQ
jgi:predicted ATPase